MRLNRFGFVTVGLLSAWGLVGSMGCGGGGGGDETPSAPANAGALDGTWSFEMVVDPLACSGTVAISGATGAGTFEIPSGGQCTPARGSVDARVADDGTVSIRFTPGNGPEFLMTGTLTGADALSGTLSGGMMIGSEAFAARRLDPTSDEARVFRRCRRHDALTADAGPSVYAVADPMACDETPRDPLR